MSASQSQERSSEDIERVEHVGEDETAAAAADMGQRAKDALVGSQATDGDWNATFASQAMADVASKLNGRPAAAASAGEPADAETAESSLYQARKRLLAAYNCHGYFGILHEACKEVQEACNTVQGCNKLAWLSHAYDILASVDTTVLLEVMTGNLARKARVDAATKKLLDSNRNLSDSQPSIYIRYLVDERGFSPTPNELLTMVDDLELYATRQSGKDRGLEADSAAMCAYKTDGFMSDLKPAVNINMSHRGFRRWLTHDGAGYPFVDGRIGQLQVFCRGLRARIQSIPESERDLPLEQPLAYIGYAKDARKRNNTAHNKHVGTSFLMGLVDITAQKLFKGKTYQMRWYVVSLCYAPPHAKICEILWTSIAQGFPKDGGGLCIWRPGENNMDNTSDLRWFEIKHAMMTRFGDMIRRNKKADQEKGRARIEQVRLAVRAREIQEATRRIEEQCDMYEEEAKRKDAEAEEERKAKTEAVLREAQKYTQVIERINQLWGTRLDFLESIDGLVAEGGGDDQSESKGYLYVDGDSDASSFPGYPDAGEDEPSGQADRGSDVESGDKALDTSGMEADEAPNVDVEEGRDTEADDVL